jgi:hypothetical protein
MILEQMLFLGCQMRERGCVTGLVTTCPGLRRHVWRSVAAAHTGRMRRRACQHIVHCAPRSLQGGCFVWGTNTNTQMAKGGDDSDNMQPKRIGRTARFRPELEVVQLAFGSQVRIVYRGCACAGGGWGGL